jgi:GT2 family glycosyltransferase
VDNGSGPETKGVFSSFRPSRANVTLIRNPDNLGWVRAVNQALRISTAGYACIMNNDTIVRTDGWLESLIRTAELEPDIGLVNPYFESKEERLPARPFIEVDFCRGYCMLIKRRVIERIGLFDESYGLGYYDDDDYSVRAIRAGFRCVRDNSVFVEHLRDSTFSSLFGDKRRLELHEKNKKLFYSRWGRRLRLVFVMTEDRDPKAASDLFFSLARRQHIIDLWNAGHRLDLAHININERPSRGPLDGMALAMDLFLNQWKKPSKRYDALFVDNIGSRPFLPRTAHRRHDVDIVRDAARIKGIADSAARV